MNGSPPLDIAELIEETAACRALWCSVLGRILLDADRPDAHGDAARDWLWPKHARFLCIPCLEACLGRVLRPADFTSAPTNEPHPWDTPRLAARLQGAADDEPEQLVLPMPLPARAP